MNLIQTIKEIQKLVGVKQDGVLGPVTAAAILTEINRQPYTISQEPPAHRFDDRTEKNLATLQPGAAAKFRPFLLRAMAIGASMGVTVKGICGMRNKTDQEKAKASGASKAGYGWSWHNYGMAIDLGVFKGPVYADEHYPKLAASVHAAIGAVAPFYGIEWGGNWKTFKDLPHFQIDLGRSTPNSDDRKKLAAGTFTY